MKAVFDTVELLEGIILQVPAADMMRLQLVSKHWKAIIEASSQIHMEYRSRLLHPVRFDGPGDPDARMPVYSKSSSIHGNPVIHHCTNRRFNQENNISFMVIDVNMIDSRSEAIVKAKKETITCPPVQSIQLQISSPVLETFSSVVTVEDGIRIGDLVAAKANLERCILAEIGLPSIPPFMKFKMKACLKEQLSIMDQN